ncbi:carbon-nitrogen family hydrolase [Jeotgalibacillus proteolyticus]|uniref:Carbon-nitrogen hydrolase n=1 Tax=Jeotgalibacillus proteolyticus TaxID=2082395 RepID=A0A2S5GGS4_9BACL|nr:carbon-nitrogen family hydrolase [Jeotgalibacillus proteolyticus]PPA72242.1 carbon-nitrogen hydrolase [Jeotgalibacillus proteolyticus]
MKIGLLQIDIKFGEPMANREYVKDQFLKAADDSYDLIILPELWSTGYDLTRLDDIGDENAQESIQFLQELAKTYNVNIIGGSVANKKGDSVYNTMIVVDRNGDLVHQYSKLHLFKLMDEHKYLSPGEDSPSFLLEGIHFGGFICYDIRFPEWIRKPVLEGAEAIVVVAEWPEARVDHWLTLLKARAIENQSYVFACNRIGADPNNAFGGNSIIIDPWGETLAQGTTQEEMVTATIDIARVKEIRSRIPVFQDRRTSFYS